MYSACCAARQIGSEVGFVKSFFTAQSFHTVAPNHRIIVALSGRLGIHEERGPTSFRLLTETIAGHDRAHLLQLEQTIAAVAQ